MNPKDLENLKTLLGVSGPDDEKTQLRKEIKGLETAFYIVISALLFALGLAIGRNL